MLNPLVFLVASAMVMALAAMVWQRRREPVFQMVSINPQPSPPETVFEPLMMEVLSFESNKSRGVVRCPGPGDLSGDAWRFPGLRFNPKHSKVQEDAMLQAKQDRRSSLRSLRRPSRPGLRRALAQFFQDAGGRDEALMRLVSLKDSLPPADARLAQEILEEVFPRDASYRGVN